LTYKGIRYINHWRRRELMDDLKLQIKELIVSALELEDVRPENIVDSEPIFGEGLGLDSIDALELGVALKKKFGVKFAAENEDNRKHFASVDALAAYISTETAGNC
jgi:acyl carrier protein